MKGLTTEQGRELFDMLPTTGKDEVAPASWEDGIDIGSAITLQLGQRTFHDAERNRDRACLASEGTYTTETKQGTALSEWLASPGPVQNTVVGFYDQEMAYLTSWMLGSGYLGFVSGEDLTARSTDAFVGTDLATYPELLDRIKDYTGMDMPVFMSGGTVLEYWDNSTFAEIHDSLLRYQGIDQERAIYSTLYLMAAILSLVVVVASISLIYNSFAIAVSERTRQYGLLASLGASRHQIRRTVYTEALLLAAIGIPAGILLGLAGTWVVFQLSSEGIGALIDADLDEFGFSSLHVSPTVIGICVVLSLITVLVSAAIPAIRASRVRPADSSTIRQSRDVKLDAPRAKGRHKWKGGPLRPILPASGRRIGMDCPSQPHPFLKQGTRRCGLARRVRGIAHHLVRHRALAGRHRADHGQRQHRRHPGHGRSRAHGR